MVKIMYHHPQLDFAVTLVYCGLTVVIHAGLSGADLTMAELAPGL